MRRLVLPVALALAAALACTLQAGVKDLCSTDGDCNPGRVCTNGTCGAPGSADAEASDSASDAGAPDAPPPFCVNAPTPYTICDDFDEDAEGKNILVGWDNILENMDIGVSGGGKIESNASPAFSYTPPRSVHFYLPPLVGATNQAVANLMKKVNSPSSLGVQFQFYIQTDMIPVPNRIELVFVDFNRAAGLAIVLGANGLQAIVAVGAQPVDTTYTIKAPITLGTWHKLVLSTVIASPDAGPGRFGILLDGNGEADGPLPPAFAAAGADEVDIGPAAQGPMGTFEIYVDDVLIN